MVSQFALLDLSPVSLLIILAVILLLFGAKKLPELSRSVGESARELRKGLNSDEEDKKKQTTQSESSKSK